MEKQNFPVKNRVVDIFKKKQGIPDTVVLGYLLQNKRIEAMNQVCQYSRLTVQAFLLTTLTF